MKLLNNMEHGSDRINNIVSELRNFANPGFRLKSISTSWWTGNHLTGKQVGKLVKSYRVELADNLQNRGQSRRLNRFDQPGLKCRASVDKEDSYVLLKAQRSVNPYAGTFEIEDNGCGMDETVRSASLIPFSRPRKAWTAPVSACRFPTLSFRTTAETFP